MKKEIVYIDMDNVLVDFQSGLNQIPAEIKAFFEKDEDGKPHYDDIPFIFSKMSPMPGAVEAVKRLSEKYDLYILSTAPWNNASAWVNKLEWVKKYFDSSKKDGVFYKRLILTHHKDLCYRENAFLIDDRPFHGADQFGDHWIQFGTEPYKTWDDVLKYLMNR